MPSGRDPAELFEQVHEPRFADDVFRHRVDEQGEALRPFVASVFAPRPGRRGPEARLFQDVEFEVVGVLARQARHCLGEAEVAPHLLHEATAGLFPGFPRGDVGARREAVSVGPPAAETLLDLLDRNAFLLPRPIDELAVRARCDEPVAELLEHRPLLATSGSFLDRPQPGELPSALLFRLLSLLLHMRAPFPGRASTKGWWTDDVAGRLALAHGATSRVGRGGRADRNVDVRVVQQEREVSLSHAALPCAPFRVCRKCDHGLPPRLVMRHRVARGSSGRNDKMSKIRGYFVLFFVVFGQQRETPRPLTRSRPANCLARRPRSLAREQQDGRGGAVGRTGPAASAPSGGALTISVRVPSEVTQSVNPRCRYRRRTAPSSLRARCRPHGDDPPPRRARGASARLQALGFRGWAP